MNPFLQRKPKRQRTGAVQDLAEARKHVVLACVLECGSPLPLSDERFIESFNILASRLVSSLVPPQMGSLRNGVLDLPVHGEGEHPTSPAPGIGFKS